MILCAYIYQSYTYLSIILIDSIYKIVEDYYPHIFLEECCNAGNITHKIGIPSDESDKSLKENNVD